MKRKVSFVHTSPAAIAPLMQFYSEAAPEIEVTNLLDDGILRLFTSDPASAGPRLAEMIRVGRDTYGAEMALVTCSAVTRGMLTHLRRDPGLPLVKIDEPMARQAVASGRRIGLIVTFPPTRETTGKLLAAAAEEAGVAIEIVDEVLPDAYRALLGGDPQEHDRALLGAVDRLAGRDVSCIVLAQVSMARVLGQARARTTAPVLSSLDTSLGAVRELLGDSK